MKRLSSIYLAIIFIIIPICIVIAKENIEWAEGKVHPPKIGNFALPVSQQPAPLISFGQNIPDKGILQVFSYGSQARGTRKSFAEITPSLLYGITDKFSLFIELPIAVKFRQEQFKSRGLADLIIQLEGVVYIKETASSVNEITLVGNVGFPTGSVRKEPPTSFGAPRFFLGFTASHSEPTWYYFTSMGGVLTTSHKGTKFGKEFLYQFGLGRNIAYKTDQWILNWLVEFDGLYEQRSRVAGVIDPNSGGNVVLLGPSLWFSTQRFIVQGGISAVVAEHLFGIQLKNHYFLAAYVGWTF